jgi:hypothetical protein
VTEEEETLAAAAHTSMPLMLSTWQAVQKTTVR